MAGMTAGQACVRPSWRWLHTVFGLSSTMQPETQHNQKLSDAASSDGVKAGQLPDQPDGAVYYYDAGVFPQR
jgi:hypothetical protein